ncbi:MAG: NAD-dependent epimerase/dehydratase family protein, partial [bacterium]
EDGSCIRDYIHVSDLADAHLRALNFLEERDEDLVLNLGTSKGISVLEILDSARKVSGMDLPVILSDRRPGDPAVVLASAEKAERLLEWSPAFSDVETILKTMLAAYRSHHR